MNKLSFKQKLHTVAEFLTLVWIFFVFIVFMIAGNV